MEYGYPMRYVLGVSTYFVLVAARCGDAGSAAVLEMPRDRTGQEHHSRRTTRNRRSSIEL
eukprot:1094481-Pleurochrysis_carterae.AAC.1